MLTPVKIRAIQRQKEVVETFIIDWPVLILLGIVFGYGAKQRAEVSLFKSHAFWSGMLIVAAFSALAYWSYILAPDWMFMYVVEAKQVPAILIYGILILYACVYAFGFTAKHELEKISSSLPRLAILICVIAEIGIILSFKDQYINVATRAQFLNGAKELWMPLPKSKVGGFPIGFFGALLVPASVGLLLWARKNETR